MSYFSSTSPNWEGELMVTLALPNVLSVKRTRGEGPNLDAETPLELDHDVLVGIERTAIESISPGAVVTLMLWGKPAR
jgi:hypothetical protein